MDGSDNGDRPTVELFVKVRSFDIGVNDEKSASWQSNSKRGVTKHRSGRTVQGWVISKTDILCLTLGRFVSMEMS